MRLRYIIVGIIAFIAYIFGTKAGRDRYETIKHTTTKYWNDPKTKKARSKAQKARVAATKAVAKRVKTFAR